METIVSQIVDLRVRIFLNIYNIESSVAIDIIVDKIDREINKFIT